MGSQLTWKPQVSGIKRGCMQTSKLMEVCISCWALLIFSSSATELSIKAHPCIDKPSNLLQKVTDSYRDSINLRGTPMRNVNVVFPVWHFAGYKISRSLRMYMLPLQLPCNEGPQLKEHGQSQRFYHNMWFDIQVREHCTHVFIYPGLHIRDAIGVIKAYSHRNRQTHLIMKWLNLW